MKPLFRLGCILLIFLGMASQAYRGIRSEPESEMVAPLAERLQTLGISTEENALTPSMIIGKSQLCDQRLRATLLQLDGAEDDTAGELRSPGFVNRYIYLGAVTEYPSRTTLIGQRIWQTFRFIIGLRASRPSTRLVLVALPRECPDLLTINWSALSPAI